MGAVDNMATYDGAVDNGVGHNGVADNGVTNDVTATSPLPIMTVSWVMEPWMMGAVDGQV